jgi:hypothetical protein
MKYAPTKSWASETGRSYFNGCYIIAWKLDLGVKLHFTAHFPF